MSRKISIAAHLVVAAGLLAIVSAGRADEGSSGAAADRATSSRLIGLWGVSTDKLRGVAFYRADGTCISANTTADVNDGEAYRVVFKWRVENGKVFRTVVDAGKSTFKAGEVQSADIVKLEGDDLTLRFASDYVLSYRRQPMNDALKAQASAPPAAPKPAAAQTVKRKIEVTVELPPVERTVVRPASPRAPVAQAPAPRNAEKGAPPKAAAAQRPPVARPAAAPARGDLATARQQVTRLLGAIETMDASFHQSTNFRNDQQFRTDLDDFQASFPGQRAQISPVQRVLGSGVGINGQYGALQRINTLTQQLIEAAQPLPAAEQIETLDRLIEMARDRNRRLPNPANSLYLSALLQRRAELR